MSDPLGREIYCCRDDWGTIRVLEAGSRRHLRFGYHDEQSCVDLVRPESLVYEYTQAMVLGALFAPEPRRILLLGLGGGALVHALRRMLPLAEITVLERRQKVVDTARNFFGLREVSGVEYVVEGAAQYMGRSFEPWDLIFVDLYDEDGMSPEQEEVGFLELCVDRLTTVGVVVVNLWCAAEELNARCVGRLRTRLGGEVLVCDMPEGNRVVYGLMGTAPWSPRHFVPVARRLGRQLGCALHRRAASLRRCE